MPIRGPLLVSIVLLAVLSVACTQVPTSDEADAEIWLKDSNTAIQLGNRLPMLLIFTDRMGTAQIARLPEAMPVGRDDRVGGYRAGDVAYWAREQSIIVFQSGGGAPSEDLVLVGHITAGLDDLASCTICTVNLHQTDDR